MAGLGRAWTFSTSEVLDLLRDGLDLPGCGVEGLRGLLLALPVGWALRTGLEQLG